MLNRVKEEERIERIIRGLLKLPDNRRCINCNSLGPQYVCTTFWTFVCTSCSGVHREFTHRVKSVSMAQFKADEVSALQAAGNERAKQIYFKTWDPHRNSHPESGNLHKIREFIKHVYIDRKYSGGRDSDKLAMVRVEPKDERHPFEKSGHGARDNYSDRCSLEKPIAKIELRNFIEERRSPRVKEIEKPGSGRKSRSTARFEIVDDRFRDDSYGSGRQSRLSSAEPRGGSLSPDSQKRRETSGGLPRVRPLKEILGCTLSPQKACDTPKGHDRRDSDGAAHAQKTVPSCTMRSADGKAVEQKTVSLSSLIDFGTEPELPDASSAQPQNQLAVTTIDGGNSSVQSSSIEKAPPPNMNSVESLLFGLSSPAAAPVSSTPQASAAMPMNPAEHVNTSVAASTAENALELVPCNSGNDALQATDGQLMPTVQPHQPSTSLTGNRNSTAQPSSSSVGALYNQQSWTSPASNAQTPFSNASADQSSQPVPQPAQEASSEGGLKAAGRKELPADIFALSYSSYPAPVPHWQYRQTPEMGYDMQYHHPAAVAQQQGYPSTGRSTNPFDLGDDTPQVQAPTFPSMLPTQGALPHISTPHMGLQPQSSPYAPSQPPFQQPSYGMNMTPGAYMGQQLPNNMLVSRPQGNNNAGTGSAAAFASLNPLQQPTNQQRNSHFHGGGEAAFASLNPLQMSGGRSQAPSTPNSYSSLGGNPFG